jgi:hypothetical protein
MGLSALSRGAARGYIEGMKNLLAAAALALTVPASAQTLSGAFSDLSARMAASRASMSASARAARGYAAAAPAPNFVLNTPQGEGRSLARYAGQVVILEFWANWAAATKSAAPARTDLARRWAASGVAMLDIGVGETAAGADAFSALSAPAGNETILLDPDQAVFNAYGGRQLPLAVVVDKDGNIAATIPGADAAAVDAAVRAALAR